MENGGTVYYNWLDYFTGIWHSAKCEIVRRGRKTVTIRLLECARGGALPGTILRVMKKSVVEKAETQDEKWKCYNYFD